MLPEDKDLEIEAATKGCTFRVSVQEYVQHRLICCRTIYNNIQNI